MRIKSLFAGAVLALGLAAVAPSSAQAQVGFVVQGSYGFDVEALGVGGGVNLGLGSLTEKQGIRLEATFDYFLADDPLTYWEINGNLLKDIPSIANLYVGAGINYAKSSIDSGICGTLVDCDNSEIGLNILGGYKLGSGKAAPFVQARFALGGGEQLYVTGGFRF
ncbi:MAG: hypothetical protein SFU84_06585 [Gemmatimonadales bacterium]|jgi:hypothetical protein|nr:hypothetical protein [Gemmatimonadales bacterium]